jgi:hypothetical protein
MSEWVSESELHAGWLHIAPPLPTAMLSCIAMTGYENVQSHHGVLCQMGHQVHEPSHQEVKDVPGVLGVAEYHALLFVSTDNDVCPGVTWGELPSEGRREVPWPGWRE